MKLDPKGLEAAKLYAKSETLLVLDSGITGLIRAYLSAITPAEAGGLVERLRSVVEISEPLEAENCVEAWNWLVKQAHEAATALTAERAAHAETKRERDEAHQEYMLLDQRYDRRGVEMALAEARLAEALKALDGLLEPFEGDDCRYDHHGYCQAHFLQEGDECCVKIARRVREGGKADG